MRKLRLNWVRKTRKLSFNVSRKPSFALWLNLMVRPLDRAPGQASDLYGIHVGYDIMRDCSGVFVHWGQSRYGLIFDIYRYRGGI